MKNIIESPAPIDRCPHCGSDYGYFTKDYIYGSSRFLHKFDGTEADNDALYDCVTIKNGKRAYCIECGKFLFTMKIWRKLNDFNN